MQKLPKARTENLVEQTLDKEVLLYDTITHKAYNLNETLSIVYKACNGKTSFDDLKRRAQFADDFIYLALDQLKRENLLADNSYNSPLSGINRRDVIRKVGLATAFALPVITGLVAPKAANAASGGSADGARGYTLHAACGDYGACWSDGDGRLTCIDDKCCRLSGRSGSASPGTSIQAQSCRSENEPVTQYTCNDFAYKCCSGKISGTCISERIVGASYDDSGLPVDENGWNIPCVTEDGGWTYVPYEVKCNCTCL